MFAAVQLCDRSKRLNVPVSDFKSFDPLNYIKNHKYKVKIAETYEDAVVLHVAKTMKELEEFIKKKRIAPPPASTLISASESSSADEGETSINATGSLARAKKVNRKTSARNSTTAENSLFQLQMKGEAYEKPRRGRSIQTKHSVQMPPNRAPTSSENKNKDLVQTFGLPKLNTEATKILGSSIRNPVTSFVNHGLFKKPANPKDILEKENVGHENVFSRNSESKSPNTSTPSIEDKNKSAICDHTCAETVKNLESKISNLSKTIKELESVLQQKEEDIRQKDIEVEHCLRTSEARKLMVLNREKELIDLRKLNRDLQDAAIDNLISLKDTIQEQLEKAKIHNKVAEKEEYEIGHCDETKRMIYISRGEWLGYDTFKMCTDNVKTYAQVAKNLAVAIFGYEVLRKATVTGKSSNRSKNRSNPLQKLEGKKILCLKEIFKYYLSDILRVDEEIVDEQLDRVRTYIAKKISDLKKKPKTSSINASNAKDQDQDFEDEIDQTPLVHATHTDAEDGQNVRLISQTTEQHSSNDESDNNSDGSELNVQNEQYSPNVIGEDSYSEPGSPNVNGKDLHSEENTHANLTSETENIENHTKQYDNTLDDEEFAFIELDRSQPLSFAYVNVPVIESSSLSPEILTILNNNTT